MAFLGLYSAWAFSIGHTPSFAACRRAAGPLLAAATEVELDKAVVLQVCHSLTRSVKLTLSLYHNIVSSLERKGIEDV